MLCLLVTLRSWVRRAWSPAWPVPRVREFGIRSGVASRVRSSLRRTTARHRVPAAQRRSLLDVGRPSCPAVLACTRSGCDAPARPRTVNRWHQDRQSLRSGSAAQRSSDVEAVDGPVSDPGPRIRRRLQSRRLTSGCRPRTSALCARGLRACPGFRCRLEHLGPSDPRTRKSVADLERWLPTDSSVR